MAAEISAQTTVDGDVVHETTVAADKVSEALEQTHKSVNAAITEQVEQTKAAAGDAQPADPATEPTQGESDAPPAGGADEDSAPATEDAAVAAEPAAAAEATATATEEAAAPTEDAATEVPKEEKSESKGEESPNSDKKRPLDAKEGVAEESEAKKPKTADE